MRDIVLMIVTLVCCFAALRRPFVGMMAFVCYGLLAPQSLTWSIARTFPHSLVLAACTIAGYIFSQERKFLPICRELIMVVGLWSLFALSTVFAIEPDAAWEKFVWISKILFMILLSTALVNDEHKLKVLLRVIALSLGFYALKGGVFFIRTGGEGTVEAPYGSFLSANNSLGAALVMNVPLLFYLIKMESNPWFKRLLVVSLAMSYPAVVGTFSRGAWVGLACVTLLMALKSEKKLLVVALVAIVGLGALMWLPDLSGDRLTSRFKTMENIQVENSAQQRLWSWEFCKRVGLDRPLTGGGFDYYSIDAYATYYPEFIEQWPGKVWSCHSTWLTIWGEHGILAFILWVVLIASLFISARWMRRRIRRNPELVWFQPWPRLIECSVMGFIICGTFIDFAYFDLYFQIVAIVVVAKDLMEKRLQASIDREVSRDALTQGLEPAILVQRRRDEYA